MTEKVLNAKPNPRGAGRPKGSANKAARFELTSHARLYGLEALVEIVNQLRDDKATDETRFRAAKEILDRGFGRSKQITEISGLDGEDLVTTLNVNFIGQVPIRANVAAKLNDEQGKTIDMELETVRVPVFKRPWDSD